MRLVYENAIAEVDSLPGSSQDACVCTSDASNTYQESILLDAGWEIAGRFKSRKTGHDVILWFKALNKWKP